MRKNWSELRSAILEVEEQVPEDALDVWKKAERRSEQFGMHRRFLALAQEEAISKGLKPSSYEAEELFDRAIDISSDLAQPTRGSFYFVDEFASEISTEDRNRFFRMTYPAKGRDLDHCLKTIGSLEIDRVEFECPIRVHD